MKTLTARLDVARSLAGAAPFRPLAAATRTAPAGGFRTFPIYPAGEAHALKADPRTSAARMAATRPEGSRLLYISGEVGVLPDGTVPQGIEAQAEACWRTFYLALRLNCSALLARTDGSRP
jgi:hypothetical protein